MAALTQIQALSILSDRDLANLFSESSFYQLCAQGLRFNQGNNVRLLVEKRLLAETVADAPLLSVLHQIFDGDPLNQEVQAAFCSLYHSLGLLSQDSYEALIAAILG